MMQRKLVLGALLGFSVFSASSALAGSLGGATVANNTPRFVAQSTSTGTVEPSTVIDVSIWLKPHNQADLDALAKSLYVPGSANYRKFLSKAEFTKQFAPTAAEAAAVQSFFTANHMTVTKVGPDNFFVRATGTVDQVNKAFNVTLKNFNLNGQTVRANDTDPVVSGAAAAFVKSVSGLTSLGYVHHNIKTATLASHAPSGSGGGANTGAVAAVKSAAAKKAAASTTLPASDFNDKCFTGVGTDVYTTEGSLPKATYTGLQYTAAAGGCGYIPSNIQAAYRLNELYAEGFDGTGQTIVILDWCGSPTIKSDANAFSAQFGLPALTSSNFNIIYTPTPSYCEAPDPEINIDVEWAHAIAPGANITLVVPPSNSFQDIDEGTFYAVDYQLGNVFSGSYGAEEAYEDSATLEEESLISEIASILGISTNYSSGDDGDFTYDYPQYYTASVSSPADSPYATAVGGISLRLDKANGVDWQAGWGTNVNPLSSEGYVYDPPTDGFFEYGSGGGESAFFSQPPFQAGLPGTGRELPDISWLADPFTGAYIAISEPGVTPELQYEVYGGTSLACPMFSALWAIANQEAGSPLGQAAPYLYGMPASTISDVTPFSLKNNVTGVVKDSSGKTSYTAAELAAPLENTTLFASALWNYPLEEDTAYILTFGTDSGLTIGSGWDNVTGLGVPNAKAFADYFNPSSSTSAVAPAIK